MEFHEYANIFPLFGGKELENLRADIEKNGLVEPVVTFEGKVLDGRNRETACSMLGITPNRIEYTGDDPIAFVLSKNLHRRHLNESQRATIAAKIANIPPHRPSNKSANLRTSQAEAAKMLNVSERSVNKAKKVLNEADAETIQEVESGKKSVSCAVETLRRNQKEREEREIANAIAFAGKEVLIKEPPREVERKHPVEEPESEETENPIVRANAKEASIIASINLIGRDIEEYGEIAPTAEMHCEATGNFIRAFCDLFDKQYVKIIAAKL